MTTVRDVIETAFRHLGVVAEDEAMSADQGAVGLTVFNNMISGWALEELVIGAAFLDAALSDVFPLPDKFREGVGYLLAARLSPAYGTPLGFDQEAFYAKVRTHYLSIEAATVDPALTWRGSTLRRGLRRGLW